jgi:hypothetical protein
MSYVQHQKDAGRTPRCSICRLELLPTPIRNLALEQLIAAQKQATIAEVQQAAAAADAAAAAEEAQEVAAAAARLEELDKKEAEEAEKISYASAMAVAKAAGEGDVAEQAKMLAEYAKTPPARCAAPPAAPDWPEAPHWMSALSFAFSFSLAEAPHQENAQPAARRSAGLGTSHGQPPTRHMRCEAMLCSPSRAHNWAPFLMVSRSPPHRSSGMRMRRRRPSASVWGARRSCRQIWRQRLSRRAYSAVSRHRRLFCARPPTVRCGGYQLQARMVARGPKSRWSE